MADGKGVTVLDVAGPNPNVHLKIGDLSAAMVQNIPDVLTDLLEVAAYVFAADQAAGRGGARDTGKRWRRSFRFYVPVRLPDLWSRQEITEALVDALSFLSDDDYEFIFSRPERSQPVQLYLDGLVPTLEAEEVLLFSGGVDSLAGAVQAAITNERRVALVSHSSASKRVPGVANLAATIASKAPSGARHVSVWATKTENVGREFTQRTRSFLYASLATSVARMLGLDGIRFYENGVTSLNVPLAEQVVGGRATRTTHPQSLNGFARLFSLLLDRSFAIESPFLWLTKGEVFRVITDGGCADLIKRTVSCSRTVEATKLHTHCGRCSQCIDRRFAALAAGLTDDEDPAEMYKVQLMTDERVVGETRTMAESFLRRALALRTMNGLDFLKAYPEASRALRHVGLPSEQAAQRIHDLHRRHGEEVQAALTEGHRRHAAEFQAAELPDSCVLVLAVPQRYRQHGAAKKVPTFRLVGDHWEVWFENEKTTLRNGVGPRHIALLLANPGQRLHAIDMQIAEAVLSGKLDLSSLDCEHGDEAGLRISRTPASSGGKATDRMAVRSYRARLDEIDEELARPAVGDPSRPMDLREEADRIQRHIGAVVNLRGNPRPSADDDEHARDAVGKAIRRTKQRLWKIHPSLARHLGKHLDEGLFCLYDPDPPVTWVTR